MDWGLLFSAINVIALIGWGLLAFTGRGPLIHSLVLYLGIGLLCLIYSVGLITMVASEGGLDFGAFGSIEGIRALFQSDAGIVIGWTHYLAFDLFVGQWIAKEADMRGFSRLAQLPILFLTLMAGPLGLLVWLIVRGRRKMRRG